jgi:ribonuclease P protein component
VYSNLTQGGFHSKNTLRKYEILRSKLLINQVFQSTEWVRSPCINAKYSWVETECAHKYLPKVLFTVSKKYLKKASERNFVKRRMKEAYRLNKQHLCRCLEEQETNSKTLLIAFIFQKSAKQTLAEQNYEDCMITCINKISKSIQHQQKK